MAEDGGALDAGSLDELRQSVGGDEQFLADLIGDFLADAPAQLESLRDAAGAGDASRARRAAHTLKGNSRTFGATELAALCQEVESAAGEDDLRAVLARLDEIDRKWARARSELVAVREGRA
jgi:HPt (histidine-containing phosphotransfer) domain-containing protein